MKKTLIFATLLLLVSVTYCSKLHSVSDFSEEYKRTEQLIEDYDYYRAEKILNEIISNNPKEFEAYLRLADLLEIESDHYIEMDEAYTRIVELLEKACTYNPPNLDDFYKKLAHAYRQKLDNESMINYYKKILSETPESKHRSVAARQLCYYYIDSPDKNEALHYLQEYLEILNDEKTEKTEYIREQLFWAKFKIAVIYEEYEKKYGPAIKLYKEIVKEKYDFRNAGVESDYYLELRIGKCYYLNEEYQKAITQFQRVLYVEPINVKGAVAFYYLGRSFENTKNNKKANETFTKLSKFLNTVKLEKLREPSKKIIFDLKNKMKVLKGQQNIHEEK